MPELSGRIQANSGQSVELSDINHSQVIDPTPSISMLTFVTSSPGFLPHLEIIFNDRSLLLLPPFDERTATFHGLK